MSFELEERRMIWASFPDDTDKQSCFRRVWTSLWNEMPQLVRVLINVITSMINSFPRRRHQRAVVTPHLNTGLWLSMESWCPGQRQTQTRVWWDVWQLTMIWRWSYFLTYLLFWTLNNVEYLFFLFGSFGTGSNISSLIWITIDWFDHTSAKINWMNFRNIWPSLQLCRRFGELDWEVVSYII